MQHAMTWNICAVVILLAGCRKEPPLTRVETPQQAACLVPCDAARDQCIAQESMDERQLSEEISTGVYTDPSRQPSRDDCLENRLICALECGLQIRTL